MSVYSEKLKDPRWQKKRLSVMSRSGFKCEACMDDKETLQVHHLIYTKGEPWDIPDEMLECLCESCHEWRESFNDFWGRSLYPTWFCMHLIERLSPALSGERTFKRYPHLLAMIFDITKEVVEKDKIPSEYPCSGRASVSEANHVFKAGHH